MKYAVFYNVKPVVVVDHQLRDLDLPLVLPVEDVCQVHRVGDEKEEVEAEVDEEDLADPPPFDLQKRLNHRMHQHFFGGAIFEVQQVFDDVDLGRKCSFTQPCHFLEHCITARISCTFRSRELTDFKKRGV